jgi:hypothetical protein
MAELALRNGGVTLVDDEDLEWLAQYRWFGYEMKSRRRYAMTDIHGERIYIHRLIMDAPVGLEVDHKNGDSLDNRRSNLRVVTHQVNMRNRHGGLGASGVRNVFPVRGRYQVALHPKSGAIYIGMFDTLDDAKAAAEQARATYYAVGTARETIDLVAKRVRYCALCRNEGSPNVPSTGVLHRGRRLIPSVNKMRPFRAYLCEDHKHKVSLDLTTD